MPQFTKKPVTIEAIQFTQENREALNKWLDNNDANNMTGFGWEGDSRLVIRTLEGDMRADLGDWIIKGISGEFYPCKPDIFEKTYRAGGPELAAYDSKADTLEHMRVVGTQVHRVINELLHRIEIHDVGKLGVNEKPIFDEMTPKLKASTYGSDEYKGFLKYMDKALQHHYATNRHHPEFFEQGIKGMNLIDMLEMLCDWFAATKRHADGNLMKSVDLNQKRFGYSDELRQIFENTARWLLGEKLEYTRPVKGD